MIELNTLAKNMENGLNALSSQNGLGIVFKIHSDEGEYNYALKSRVKRQRYTNGLLQISSSSIVPVQNLVVATQAARLDLSVQLPDKNTDAQIINAHRGLIDGYFSATALQMLEDASGKKYSVASVYSLATTGAVSVESPLGTNIKFIVFVNYSMVQNGLNSSEFTVTLDGAAVEYTSLTIDRTPAMESAAYSNTNGAAKNVANSTALNFHLQIPATITDNAANAALRQFVLDGDMQTKHTLIVDIGGESRTYTVVFGATNIALNGLQNAGYTVTFVEAANLAEVSDDGGRA